MISRAAEDLCGVVFGRGFRASKPCISTDVAWAVLSRLDAVVNEAVALVGIGAALLLDGGDGFFV